MARPKKARAQPNLTAERIRDAALRLIEQDGLEELSTRKLGRALGVEAMAIYWYYPSKDALLDAVVEALVSKLAQTRPPSEAPVDFIDALRGLAHAYRALAHAYPKAFPLLATRRFSTEPTYRFLDGLFTLAAARGLDARTTARFYRLVASYCSGVALDEIAGRREAVENADVSAARAAHPRLATVWEWLAPEHYDDVFSFGLEVVLSALQAQMPAPAGKSEAPRAPAKARRAR